MAPDRPGQARCLHALQPLACQPTCLRSQVRPAQLFAEGAYNERLEVISDVPKGNVVWWFDRTDMKRAKETVGKVACLAGNVPLDLLCAGTPEEVRAYCRTLIDVAGRDGGFILSSGAGLQGSKPENVKAMIDFSKQYGMYH